MLFTIGAVGLLVRRNTLVMFMCIELMLNAANLTFVSFAKALNDISGQVIVFFTLVVAAAEVAVGLAIIVAIFRRRQDVDRRRRRSAEGLRRIVSGHEPPRSRWLIPALPAFGAVVLLLFGKRIGEPQCGLDRDRDDRRSRSSCSVDRVLRAARSRPPTQREQVRTASRGSRPAPSASTSASSSIRCRRR